MGWLWVDGTAGARCGGAVECGLWTCWCSRALCYARGSRHRASRTAGTAAPIQALLRGVLDAPAEGRPAKMAKASRVAKPSGSKQRPVCQVRSLHHSQKLAFTLRLACVSRHPAHCKSRWYTQVAGCECDLSHSRAYYRRYRICEAHFRMPSMTLDGGQVR
jgi:hypothetical protein